jgi:hypothetical protein
MTRKRTFQAILALSLVVTGVLIINHLLFPLPWGNCTCRDYSDMAETCDDICSYYTGSTCLFFAADPYGTCVGTKCWTYFTLFCDDDNFTHYRSLSGKSCYLQCMEA